jgi:NagD protein
MTPSKNAFLLDMDGVIYREDHLIPGAPRFIALLLEKEIPFLFLTNNSAPTPEDLTVKLGHLGIKGLQPRHFYTSALNTADFLWETHPTCTAYVLGEAGLIGALQDAKIANDPIAPHYVVVGEGSPSMDKIAKAHELLERGARLVVTNPDCWCPVAGNKTRPGAGALAAFLQTSSGQRPYYLGKPNPYMFSRARKRLMVPPSQEPNVVMVGDTMETDIRGAIEIGMPAYLVLTGSTSLGDLGDYVYQPTRVLESVADLIEEIDTGKPSDRLGSPAFQAPARLIEGPKKKRYATA